MPILLPQHHTLSVGATRIVRVNYTEDLDSGETLSSPTLTEIGTTDLTIATSDVVVNTATFVDSEGVTIAVGKAVLASVTGGTAANSPYTLRVTATTNSWPAQVLPYDFEISFV